MIKVQNYSRLSFIQGVDGSVDGFAIVVETPIKKSFNATEVYRLLKRGVILSGLF